MSSRGLSTHDSLPRYKDGTTHIVMEPLEFVERPAALVPRPRLHLIPFGRLRAGRFHGVLAPNTKLRSKIVPAPPSPATPLSSVPAPASTAAEFSSEDGHGQGAPARMSWARLLKRVFDIDVEHCPNCGGDLKIIAAPSTGCYVDVKPIIYEASFFLMTLLLPDQR